MTRNVRLLGLDLSTDTLEDAIAWLQQRPADAPFDYIVTPNADHFVRLSRTSALRPVYDQGGCGCSTCGSSRGSRGCWACVRRAS